jgi:hypothetical protein
VSQRHCMPLAQQAIPVTVKLWSGTVAYIVLPTKLLLCIYVCTTPRNTDGGGLHRDTGARWRGRAPACQALIAEIRIIVTVFIYASSTTILQKTVIKLFRIISGRL